ncbi:MAG: DUF5667 domain-containing protein [Nocardioidaceae bacterium]
MLSRLWGGRRADAFQNAVDGHVEPTDRELNEFVSLARTVRQMPAVQLRDETRAAMRARLVSEAEYVLTAPSAPVTSPRPRRHKGIRVAVGATVIVTAMSGGLVSVSANSLPGDLLYPIKMGVERVETTFDGGPADAGRTRFEHASNRLDEAEQLARNGEIDRVSSALDAFSNEADAGAEQLLRAFADNADATSITTIRSFTHSAAGRLGTIAGILDESTMPSYNQAVATVTAIDKRAISACPECSIQPPVDVPYALGPEPGDNNVTLPPITLPGLDDHFGDEGPNGLPDDVFTEPQIIPPGTDIPPSNDDVVPPDNTDNSDDGPTLKPHSGSDHQTEPKDKSPKDDDGGLLPGLTDLPSDRGGSGGNLPQAPLDDVIRPLDKLLGPDGPLGPLGDLLDPLLGDRNGQKDSKNDDGTLEGLLGPLLGDDGGDSGENKDEESTPEDDQSPGVLDGLLGPDTDSEDVPEEQAPESPDPLEPESGQTEQQGPLDELGGVQESDDEYGEMDGLDGDTMRDGQ